MKGNHGFSSVARELIKVILQSSYINLRHCVRQESDQHEKFNAALITILFKLEFQHLSKQGGEDLEASSKKT